MATQIKEEQPVHQQDIIFGNDVWGEASIFNVSQIMREIVADWRERYGDGIESISGWELARRAVKAEILRSQNKSTTDQSTNMPRNQ